ncbi:MAG: hypothetical protein RI556_11540 [Hydrogenovibrio sp.]|uniref:hypothetical protein n=1 Tax=Hydrogenovibrio sp. TaxID=2065821 RepID=UPI00287006B2|nr:hypothetical protein [Hydrogenovibrio sp.]MDR9499800.1 hypothetical protein [Hydrogenovibrio sp.]
MIRSLFGFSTKGVGAKGIMGVLIGSAIFKLLDMLSLGLVVFLGVDTTFDFIEAKILEYSSFSFMGEYLNLALTALNEMYFFESLSILVSALSIAFTLHVYKMAIRPRQGRLF